MLFEKAVAGLDVSFEEKSTLLVPLKRPYEWVESCCEARASA